jgi:hypothetical protein
VLDAAGAEGFDWESSQEADFGIVAHAHCMSVEVYCGSGTRVPASDKENTMNLKEYGDSGRARHDAFAQVVRQELERALLDRVDVPHPLSIQCRAKTVAISSFA